jgi:hypothetical protein
MTAADLAELEAWLADFTNPRPFYPGLAIDG